MQGARKALRHEQVVGLYLKREADIGRGGGDRKQYRTEFQALRGNAGKHKVIEKERWGTQRNPYWPLNGPSFRDPNFSTASRPF